MIDWKRKLTSRKFWVAVVGLVSGILLIFKVDGETIDRITGVIMAAASVIAYTIGEGIADSATTTTYLVEESEDVGTDESESR